jgi:hypothetical protein
MARDFYLLVRDQGVGGSNPPTPTSQAKNRVNFGVLHFRLLC